MSIFIIPSHPHLLYTNFFYFLWFLFLVNSLLHNTIFRFLTWQNCIEEKERSRWSEMYNCCNHSILFTCSSKLLHNQRVTLLQFKFSLQNKKAHVRNFTFERCMTTMTCVTFSLILWVLHSNLLLKKWRQAWTQSL